jgi:hypothetical protein
MSEQSVAFQLAESIHGSLYNDPVNQRRGQIAAGEVRADISEPYKTQRLTVTGEIEGRPVYQHLSRSIRNGYYYLSTVFTEPGGEVRTARITEESPAEAAEALAASLFTGALRQLAETRE